MYKWYAPSPRPKKTRILRIPLSIIFYWLLYYFKYMMLAMPVLPGRTYK